MGSPHRLALPAGRTALVAAVVVLAAAAAPTLAPAPAGAQVTTGPGSARITADELAGHIGYLSSDALAGRRAGTAGAELAALYIARRFQQAGLEPADDLDGYLQPFDFPIGVELGSSNRLVLHDRGDVSTTFTPGLDFLPLAGSVSDQIARSVVFAGYGISAPSLGYDDYAGIDVRGRIVVVLRFSPEGDDPRGKFGRFLSEDHKAVTARARGARGILFVNGPATEGIDRLMPFATDERPGSLGIAAMSVSQGVALRIAGAGGLDLARVQRTIDRTGRPLSMGIDDVALELEVDVRARIRSSHNVVGVLPGRERADEIVVVGAHYDGLGYGGPGSFDPIPGEVHPGADDNASGVAALIELAQFFAHPANRPLRTLVFVAFGAEETGMFGSARFVADSPLDIGDVVAMVNLDMLGRLRNELIVHGSGSSTLWPFLLAVAERRLEVPIRSIPEAPGTSDHIAFHRRRIPVLSFSTGVHEDYHRSTDVPGKIDLEGLIEATGAIATVIDRLARIPDPPPFVDRPILARTGAEPEAERGVRMGAVPAAEQRGEGVLIDLVVDGSPAALAGLAPGDRIVRVADRVIETVYDYNQALKEQEPGRPIRVTVLRAGFPRELAVVPEPAAP